MREHVGVVPQLGDFPGGAAGLVGSAAWLLADTAPERFLGPAVLWAHRRNASVVNIVSDAATGVLARRAAAFAPVPLVWRVDGSRLFSASATPHQANIPITAELAEFATLMRSAGCDPVVERGVLVGEVAGLEVCRALMDPYTGEHRVEVGVGVHDRDAFHQMHGTLPIDLALAQVVASVAQHRRPGAAPHALNRLASERLLRSRLIAEPQLLGLRSLAPADPPVERTNLKDPVPCVGVGFDHDDQLVTVVCSTGVDLDLIPFAADARALHGGRLMVVVPERDAYPATRQVLGLLKVPASLVALP